LPENHNIPDSGEATKRKGKEKNISLWHEVATYFNETKITPCTKMWVRETPACLERALMTVLCRLAWYKIEMISCIEKKVVGWQNTCSRS
jgi:hypothetical protein